MCAPPRTITDALRAAHLGLDHLNSPAAAQLEVAAIGDVLRSLGELQAKFTAARAGFLRRFDAADAHDFDGYGTSAAWLAAMTQASPAAARAAVKQMRRLGRHRLWEEALGRGELSESWFADIDRQTKNFPAELRAGTDKILIDAAAAGADLAGLKIIAAAAFEQWQARHPGPDDGDDGFDDRYVQVGTTFGGAGVIRGDLTPECAAAVQAVLDALGKNHGPEDTRSEGQRFHDALQAGCELLIRAKMVPDRAGADTQVIAHIPVGQLRQLPGGSAVEQAWLNARAGEPGYLTGKDAEAAACDALIIPVVTGHADMTVIDRIIDLVLAHIAHPAPGRAGTGDGTAGDGGHSTGGSGHGTAGDQCPAGTGSATAGRGGTDSAAADGSGAGPGRPGLSPHAHAALRQAIARLAVDFLSGPNGLAATLRGSLLSAPYNTPSLPLDIGYSDTIPAHIRRAVQLRDKRCAWPRCGRPAAWCDIHHLDHKKDGGKTAVTDCVLLCQFHHDICIHRWGWKLTLHPDGTTTAHGPHGQVQHSHSPPTTRAG